MAVFASSFLFHSTVRADSVSDNPILFVTMVPIPRDFGTLPAVFSNHVANPDTAYRGGDLYIRYPDGSLKNLTASAGFGNSGFQGAGSIAVRDPSVHWDGTKALFSMVVGAPTQQYQVNTYRWQMYEISGLGPADTPVVSKLPNQPASYNNVMPIYAADDSIIFASDRPRDDTVLHIYPQLDEYESAQTLTGLWRLFPDGTLKLLDHAPSGDFNPIIDSFGRVIFTRWDHLQRDQQNVGASLGAYNYSSELTNDKTTSNAEVFPEPRSNKDSAYLPTVNLHTINQFFPWMMNPDGTDLETLNHIGRQEIGNYSERSFNDDPNIEEFYGQYSTGANTNDFSIFHQIKESPLEPGRYFGVNCQEFGTHAAGQIMSINGGPQVNPNDMIVTHVTHPDTSGATASPGPNHSGLYRDPLPLSNGKIMASHTAETRQDENIGTTGAPVSRYDFRLKLLNLNGSVYSAGGNVTTGITKSVSFWNPDQMVSYNGVLWEMMPVEVRTRQRPSVPSAHLPTIEAAVINSASINLADLQTYLKTNGLALIVSRNLTVRDKNDRQQPTNLRVTGTSTQSLPKGGKIYDISHFQIFQGDLIRGYTNSNTQGRRLLPVPLHNIQSGLNVAKAGAPAGAVEIAEDGSMAAFVPAGRALSWQITAEDGTPVVRERYWLTFQPGEIRVCTSCHGVNTVDHLNQPPPENAPLALARLLANFKNLPLPTPVPPANGTYKISVKGQPVLASGKKFKIMVQGGQSNDQLSLRASVRKTDCQETYSLSQGSIKREIKGKLPSGISKLTFSVTALGSNQALASKKVALRSVKRRAKAKDSRFCAQLFRSFNVKSRKN